jgi:4-amino-4-deoxy-L-arabinose transferase-like glycosyltransferase
MVLAVWREPRQAPPTGLRPLALLAAWALAIFVFFSASGSKLPGYILPLMPALAVLGAVALNGLSARAWSRQLTGALVVTTLLAVAVPWAAREVPAIAADAPLQAYAPWLLAAALVLVAGVLLALALHKRGRQQGSIAAYALALFVGTTVGLVGHEALGRASSGADLVAPMQAVLKPGMPIYGVKLLDHTLPFYLQRTLVMVASPDELEFGVQQEPQKWLPSMAAFSERWQSAAPALALMSHETFSELRAQALPMVTIAQDTRRVVVANFPRPSP